MKTDNAYDYSISLVAGLGRNVEESPETGDFSGFLRIRRELNQFLINLNHSNHADSAGHQVHFLFVALEHLDNIDKEIRISGADPEMISLEKIHEKIRSLKCLILNLIKHLTAES